MLIKNKAAIDKMRIAGGLLAKILSEIDENIKPGVSTFEIDEVIEVKMRNFGLKPECKGYAGYRHATCISINDGVVHGVPSKNVVLKAGDFVKIDVVGSFKGYCADIARFFFVGEVSEEVKKIAEVSELALKKAIEIIAPGKKVSDISATIQDFVESQGYSVIRAFAGHGIGKSLHEKPDIPNYRKNGQDCILREGMTLAIEPMISQGSYEVKVLEDGWTSKTVDGGLAGHIEDTVVVIKGGAEVLTRV